MEDKVFCELQSIAGSLSWITFWVGCIAIMGISVNAKVKRDEK